jgi:hypothetical protein
MPFDDRWLSDLLARGDVRLVGGTAHLEPPPLLSEAAFQSAVRRVAKGYGWSVMHVHDSRRSPSGFPDLLCVRDHVCLAWELKSAEGIVTLQQAHWLRLLSAVTQVEAGVYRPEEMAQMVERLRG